MSEPLRLLIVKDERLWTGVLNALRGTAPHAGYPEVLRAAPGNGCLLPGQGEEPGHEEDEEKVKLGDVTFSFRAPARPYPSMIAVKTGERYRFVPVGEIRYVEADGNHVRFHVKQETMIANRSLGSLAEGILDPNEFVRVHRSAIVNISHIAFVQQRLHGDMSIMLKDGTRVPCSRRYRGNLEARVHFTS